MTVVRLGLAAAALVAGLGLPAVAHADVDQCSSAQVLVTASPTDAAAGHRAVTLTFALAPDAESCSLTGYPGVDSGSGGPLAHAVWTPRGYMGGLPGTSDVPTTVTLTPTQSAHAVVEGVAVDADGNQCPTYTDLRVTAPDTFDTVTVAAQIDACALQVHPVTL